MILRERTSDTASFRQVYDEGEYAPLVDLHPATVLDLGAYIGVSSRWFLDHWPNCQLVAVEPDPANYELLARNLKPYADRATTIRAAAWSHEAPLRLDEQYQRVGREWSRRVRACVDGEDSDVRGYTVPQLMGDWQRVGLLKVDIEGAEVHVFADAPWLGRVDAIVAEVGHGLRGAAVMFLRAVQAHGFTVTYHGELTICKR